jgi:hypothetical protein
MIFNAHNLAIINLVVQLLLILVVFAAAYLAKIRKKFGIHCKILRIIVPIQIVLILVAMLPSMLGFIENRQLGWLINTEMLVHHSLGAIIILLWLFIILKFKGIIKMRIRLVILMRTAFILWIVVFILGVHLYTFLWL